MVKGEFKDKEFATEIKRFGDLYKKANYHEQGEFTHQYLVLLGLYKGD